MCPGLIHNPLAATARLHVASPNFAGSSDDGSYSLRVPGSLEVISRRAVIVAARLHITRRSEFCGFSSTARPWILVSNILIRLELHSLVGRVVSLYRVLFLDCGVSVTSKGRGYSSCRHQLGQASGMQKVAIVG